MQTMTAEQRRQGIGASEVAAALGINPYMSAEQLRLEKLGRLAPFDGNDDTDFGNLLEPIIAKKASEKLQCNVRRQNHAIHHIKYPWLFGHIDYRLVGKREGLEIKNSSWFMRRDWGEENTDEIPAYHLPQCHAYMLLLDFEVWNVAVYFGGSDLKLYVVKRDKEMDDLIIQGTKNFWYEFVKKDIPAPINWTTPGADELIRKLYPGTNGDFARADFDVQNWRDEINKLNQEIGKLKMLRDSYDRQIKNACGEFSGLLLPDGTGIERKKIYKKAYTVDASSYYAIKQQPMMEKKLKLLGVI